MDFFQLSGYFLAVLVGISLGLIGSGGSILAVPILVYVMAVEPVLATAYSLFVVGSTALIGGIKKAREKNVNFKMVFIFGIPSLMAVYFTRAFLIPALPEVLYLGAAFAVDKPMLLMLLFAVVMLAASFKMIQSGRLETFTVEKDKEIAYFTLILLGISIGILSGAVGAGGGFLIIPALILLAGMPIKKAVGTSLFIIAIQSLIGFVGDLQGNEIIDWNLLLGFTTASILGIFIGMYWSKKIPGAKLKTAFGYFVLVMGIYIILKELFLK